MFPLHCYKGTLAAPNKVLRLLHPPKKYTRTFVFPLSLAARTQTTYSRRTPTNFRERTLLPQNNPFTNICPQKLRQKNANKKESDVAFMQNYLGHCLNFPDMTEKWLHLNSNQQSNRHRMKSGSLVPELNCLSARRQSDCCPVCLECGTVV